MASACTASRRWPPAPPRSRCARRERRTDVDAILAACDRADGAGLHRQPEQPDRHDDRRGRGRPPRRRAAAAGAPRPRRRLRRVRRRLRRPRRPRRGARQRGDDPDLLEDPRPRRPARRLGLRPRPCRRRAEPGARAVQPLDPGARRRRGGGPRHRLDRALLRGEPPQPRPARAPTWPRSGCPRDESHANFLLARFRDRAEAEACDRALREDGIIVRRVAGYKLPAALRITVGDAEACARVAAAVGRFMQVRA